MKNPNINKKEHFEIGVTNKLRDALKSTVLVLPIDYTLEIDGILHTLKNSQDNHDLKEYILNNAYYWQETVARNLMDIGMHPLDRTIIKEYLKEINFQHSELSEKQRIKLGQLSGADLIAVSRIKRSNTQYYFLDVKVISIESSEVLLSYTIVFSSVYSDEELKRQILNKLRLIEKDDLSIK